MLLTLGALGIVGNIARVAARQAEGSHGNSGQSNPFTTDTSMQVGQCITQMEYLGRLFNSPDDCTNALDTYELAAKGGPSAMCPDGKRDGSVYDRFTDEPTILCFVLNLKQGQCYMPTHDGNELTLTMGDCDKPRLAQFRVAQRVDDSTDAAQCPARSKAITYPRPPRLYCLVPVGS